MGLVVGVNRNLGVNIGIGGAGGYPNQGSHPS